MVNVVFQTAFIGDVLLTIPTLIQLRKIRPDQKIILITRMGFGAFFKTLRLADEVFEVNKADRQSIKQLLENLAKYEIENLLCPHQSPRTAWLVSKIKAVRKIGYKSWWNFFVFTHRIRRPMAIAEPLRVLSLLGPIDNSIEEKINHFKTDLRFHNSKINTDIMHLQQTVPGVAQIEVAANPEIVTRTLARLKIQKPFVILAPSSQWPTKRWTMSGFGDLVRDLGGRGLNVYLVGTNVDKEDCNELQKNFQAKESSPGLRVEVRSIAGETDLVELHAVMSCAEVVVSNDSGPMHMAAVAGRPVVVIYGPTTLNLGFPPWASVSAVIQEDLPCRPCGLHGHIKCPIGTHDCMKKIGADRVSRAIDQLRQRAQ